MKIIEQTFLKLNLQRALSHRFHGFHLIAHYLDIARRHGLSTIVETGTARTKGNWTGDGQSTLIWDAFCAIDPGLQAISIDLDPVAIETAQAQCLHVEFMEGSSLVALPAIFKRLENCALLYLDSLDWSPETNDLSAAHHLNELESAWPHLPAGCLIVVDDCLTRTQGKHWRVAEFMSERFISPLFVGYQSGWIKPKI